MLYQTNCSPHNEKNNSYQFKELMAPPQLKRVHSSLLDQLARYIGAESFTPARREVQVLEKFVLFLKTARHQANNYEFSHLLKSQWRYST